MSRGQSLAPHCYLMLAPPHRVMPSYPGVGPQGSSSPNPPLYGRELRPRQRKSPPRSLRDGERAEGSRLPTQCYIRPVRLS